MRRGKSDRTGQITAFRGPHATELVPCHSDARGAQGGGGEVPWVAPSAAREDVQNQQLSTYSNVKKKKYSHTRYGVNHLEDFLGHLE